MKAQGFSTRHICRTLLGNENYRNRLNAFFKREDVADEIYHRACQIELNKQIESGVSGNDYTDWKKKDKPSLGAVKTSPRCLVWDLESSLLEGYFFRIWQENIPMRRIKKQAHLLSASLLLMMNQYKVIDLLQNKLRQVMILT